MSPRPYPFITSILPSRNRPSLGVREIYKKTTISEFSMKSMKSGPELIRKSCYMKDRKATLEYMQRWRKYLRSENSCRNNTRSFPLRDINRSQHFLKCIAYQHFLIDPDPHDSYFWGIGENASVAVKACFLIYDLRKNHR